MIKISKIRTYQKIARYLKSVNAIADTNVRRTKAVALALQKPINATLTALGEMFQASIVQRSRKGGKAYLRKRIGNKIVNANFAKDVAYITSLAAIDTRVAKIVGSINLTALNMWNKDDRETFNEIVDQIRTLGVGGRLGFYEVASNTYYWSLTTRWRVNLAAFIHPQQGYL
jgi:hypothetical protein